MKNQSEHQFSANNQCLHSLISETRLVFVDSAVDMLLSQGDTEASKGRDEYMEMTGKAFSRDLFEGEPTEENIREAEQIVQEEMGFSPEAATAFVQAKVDHLRTIVGLAREMRLRVQADLNAKEMAELAIIDVLTDTPNKRAYNMVAEQTIAYAKRNEKPLSVIMLDIDHFKKFNDTYGHYIGDAVLKEVPKILKKTLRGSDFIARFGGEEFVVILPDAPLEHVEEVSQRLCKGVEDKAKKLVEINYEVTLKEPITISVGYASLHQKTNLTESGILDSADSLQKAADLALYNAKTGTQGKTEKAKEGRNQAASYQDGMAQPEKKPAPDIMPPTPMGEEEDKRRVQEELRRLNTDEQMGVIKGLAPKDPEKAADFWAAIQSMAAQKQKDSQKSNEHAA